MKFVELEIDNFLSVVHTETTLNDRGLVLIQGDNKDSDSFSSNGAGKSTIFSESICWCLFGECVRGKKGDSVINRNAKKNCRVRLSIEADNKDIFEVVRHRKYKEHKNNVLLYKNGTNITGRSDTETNKMIEELLEVDFITFTNSILFGQGISKTFSGATDSEQKAILERMLQIDIFKSCQELAKKKSSETQASIKLIDHDLEIQIGNKNSLAQEIEDLQFKEQEIETKLSARILELRDELESYVLQLEELPNFSDIEQDKESIQHIIEDINTKMSEYVQYEVNKSELLGDIRSIERDNETLKNKWRVDEKKISDIRAGRNIPKTCEACGQVIPLKDTSHLEKHLEDAISETTKVIEDNNAELKDLKILVTNVDKYLESKKELEKQKEELQKDINTINLQINTYKAEGRNIKTLISKTEKQIQEQEALMGTTYTDIIESKILDSQELDKYISQNITEKEQLEKQLEKLSFWINGFGNKGIKSVLLDSVTPFLSQRANYYLTQLTDNSIEVEFDTQAELKSGEKRDRFSINIKNPNGDDSYIGSSGGEKKRIDIAINMSLQDLMQSRSNKSIDLIVYDEVHEALDEIGCEVVVQLLQEKAKTCGSIFVITHNEHLKQMFTKSLVVSKENGETKIHEESI